MSRWPKPIKLFYIGPMFRYERPQAGRQRQFHQIGLELFGIDSPSADAEVILLALGLFEALKLPNLSLEINNIGCPSCRESFKQAFKEAVKPYLSQLCQTCQDRYETNTFRMLDCKEEQCKAIYTHGPVHDFLGQENTCEACQAHFKELTDILTGMQVNYQRNKRLVRGLDYYTRTVFEITSNHLGAQNAVCGGGRYNNLVEALGGQPTPAVGWGIGMERLMMLLPEVPAKGLDYYIVTQEALRGHQLGQQVRKLGYRVEVDLTGKALGKQIAQADKLKAKKVLILGESEIATQQVTLKDLQTGEQSTYTEEAFLDLL
jgi:histidyl-tRNA synthetase